MTLDQTLLFAVLVGGLVTVFLAGFGVGLSIGTRRVTARLLVGSRSATEQGH